MKGSNLLEQGNGVSDVHNYGRSLSVVPEACRIETRTRLSIIDSQGFLNYSLSQELASRQ